MTTLLTDAPAVNVDCLNCGTTLLTPEVAGGLCGLCQAEVMSDMKSEKEQIEELTRQRDRLLDACIQVRNYAADTLDCQVCGCEDGTGHAEDCPVPQVRDAIAATGEDSVPK